MKNKEYEHITTVPGTDRDIPVTVYEERHEERHEYKTFCQKNPEYRCEFAKALNSCGDCRGR